MTQIVYIICLYMIIGCILTIILNFLSDIFRDKLAIMNPDLAKPFTIGENLLMTILWPLVIVQGVYIFIKEQ